MICEYAKESLDNARIIIDEWGGEYFKNRLSTLIKRGLNTAEKKCIKKLTTGNSCKEPLLQVADYIVGIVHREYDEEKSLKGEYRKMIQHKCVKIVVRPDVSQQEDKTD
ncbi:MAG: DUF3800 domain-containing protein [Candidatus Peribacteria bacterium]|nr:DUF3800 domain-containing protein [Candidatus Peribacteria bacterium]